MKDYSQVENENGRVLYVHNDFNPIKENGINNISATIELVYDSQIYTPSASGIMILNESTGYTHSITQITGNSIEIAVPEEGYYDFIVSFNRIDGGTAAYWVIKELVFVEEGTTIPINPEEAVNFYQK